MATKHKYLFLITVLVLMLILGGFSCVKDNTNNNSNNSNSNSNANVDGENSGAEGSAVDISDKNGGDIIVKVGDILVLDLVGNIKENQTKYYQWNVKPIPSSVPNIISLVDHINTAESPKAQEGEWISHWEFKVLKEGDFTLNFSYQGINLKIKPVKSYTIHITSIK